MSHPEPDPNDKIAARHPVCPPRLTLKLVQIRRLIDFPLPRPGSTGPGTPGTAGL